MAKRTREELLEIFNALKKEIKPYEKGDMKSQVDAEGKYDLWTDKEIVVQGRKRVGVNFVTIGLQSDYVGFYYMPIYTNEAEIRSKLAPELLKLLKGKGCFHIRSADKELMKNIKEAMKVGYEGYKHNGWI